MKKTLTLLALITTTLTYGQQQTANTEEVLRRVADNIIQKTTYKFVDAKTKQTYDSTNGLTPGTDVKAQSTFNKWAYVNGVLATGMVHLSEVLSDKKYNDYAQHNYSFIFDNLPHFEAMYKNKQKPEYNSIFAIGNLDACGAMSAGLVDVNYTAKRKDYSAYLERSADYILHKQLRLPDGTLSRPQPRYMTLWADDTYMSVPFLARMGKVTGDSKYFDDAVKQIESFTKYLYDPASSLYWHNYYSDVQMNGVGHWGRSNGWIAVAQVELLKNLPANHPKRAELIRLLLRQIVGYARYQDQTGLWHQLLDKPDSYLETSVTAMYVYAVATACSPKSPPMANCKMYVSAPIWTRQSIFTIPALPHLMILTA
jgi:unsaturated rhamnogalacturonyl hydrolase